MSSQTATPNLPETDHAQWCQYGRSVIEIEAQAIQALLERIDDKFAQACDIMLQCQGRIVVVGMGKSGHIGKKIAATLASTGTPAFFVHPGEASHGDMGMILKRDVVLMLSNSGETPEIITLLPLINQLGTPVISITGKPKSTLAQAAAVNLNIQCQREADPLGLAPTTSTTLSLVLGDALAISLLQARGFTSDDFALSHPGGNLGKQLLLSCDDLMHTDERMPSVDENTSLRDALIEITAKRMGMTVVINQAKQLAGIFTDGDLRRILDQDINIQTTAIKQVMTTQCKTISMGTRAIDALRLMETHKITSLVIVDSNNTPNGVIHLHDILSTGLAL